MKEEIFEKIKKIAEKEIACSAHKMDHIERVYNLCLYLAKKEKVDFDVLRIAAILHDIGGAKEIADPSGKTDHAIEGAKMAKPILQKLGFSEDKIKHIQECIISHRYKTDNKPRTIEAKILFDADKLDGIGAIGVARNYIWIGTNKARMYEKVNLKKYIKTNLYGGKINGRIKDKTTHNPYIEFELKSKRIPAKLYTKEAKKIGRERVQYMKSFFERMEKEIVGKI